MLPDTAQCWLLSLAREAVAAHPSPLALPDSQRLDPALRTPVGAFVTWRRHGALRGCVGRVISEEPLFRTIPAVAVLAAFEDPRFPPVDVAELTELRAEISVLSPMEAIAGADAVQIGRDGLLISAGESSGLLLPQVAPEHRLDAAAFLAAACRKAGLPDDAWQHDDVSIYRFSALVFHEDGFHLPAGAP